MCPQSIPTNDPLFRALSDSVHARTCVAVLGAGLSRPDYPTWDELVERLIVDCKLAPDELGDAGNLGIAEVAKSKGRRYHETLDTIFAETDNPDCQARYHRLARVPFASILTLNFDSVLIRTLALHRNITVSEFPALSDGHHGNREVFHIHGRLGSDRPAAEANVVLTRSDFETAYDPYEHRLHGFLQSAFLENDVCFVGCNPAEPSMAKLLAACGRFCHETHGLSDDRRPNWYLLWDDCSDPPRNIEDTGIKLVRYPRRGPEYKGIDDVLEYWGGIRAPTFRNPGVERSSYRTDVEPGQ